MYNHAMANAETCPFAPPQGCNCDNLKELLRCREYAKRNSQLDPSTEPNLMKTCVQFRIEQNAISQAECNRLNEAKSN